MIYLYYHIFDVSYLLPLILLPNKSLFLMLSNAIIHDMFNCSTFLSIMEKYQTNFTKYG